MHKYLRSIGFSQLKNRKELQRLVTNCINNSQKKDYINYPGSDDIVFVECCKEFAPEIGIAVRGEFDEDNNYIYDYYFPYLRGQQVSSEEDVTIERHAEKESYAGMCDDLRVGISLIFYFQNVIPYMKLKDGGKLPIKGTTLTLSGLSTSGSVMMPIRKNEQEKIRTRRVSKNRSHLLEEARRGDESAIEDLTLEDMDIYTAISKKIHKEDVFSIVDSYFMPYGVECDQYSVLGEILECKLVENNITNEEIYVMTINCNEIVFDICINKLDLLGEPKAGRRFKGTIWLQGYINFPESN